MPTEALQQNARGARLAKAAAALIRWAGALAVAFAGLLVIGLASAAFERTAGEERPDASASNYLDFDLAVLREATARSLDAQRPDEAHQALLSLWSNRPDWTPPRAAHRPARLVPLRDAWAATAADRSLFRTAARGAAGALPFLIGGLLLAFLGAGLAAASAEWLRARAPDASHASPLRSAVFLLAGAAAVYLLVVHPLWRMLDASVFYGRTGSLGLGFSAALFVAAFAGTLPGAAARAFFAHGSHARHLTALSGRPALLTAARLAVVDAAERLVPLVPALAAAAVFVCAKADQDPALRGDKSGLGALIRAALQEPSAAERAASCTLVAGALVLLWFVGHRFVLEVRSALRARGAA